MANKAEIGGAMRLINSKSNQNGIKYSNNVAYTAGADFVSNCVIGEIKAETKCTRCAPKSYSIIESDAT